MNLQEKYFYHNMERGKGALNLVAKLENKQTNKQALQGVGKTTEVRQTGHEIVHKQN